MAAPSPQKLATDIVELADRKRRDRATWEWHWELIAKYIFPEASPPNPDRKPAAGDRVHHDVLDNTAELDNEILASAVTDAVTPEDVDFFALRVTDDAAANDDQDVVEWLEDCVRRMMAVFRSPKAGYATAAQEMRLEMVTFGTGAMMVLDKPGVGITFVSVPLAQVLLITDSEGRVIGVLRCWEMTAREAFDKYGAASGDAIARAATATAQAEHERKFKFIHAVLPRTWRDPSLAAVDARHKPLTSTVVQVQDRIVVEDGGFDENPFITPRWGTKRTAEDYGRSQAMKVLGTVMGLQRGTRVNIQGAEQAMKPPLMVADDGVLGPVRLGTKGVTSVRADTLQGSGAPIRPIVTGARPDIGEELLAGMRERIHDAYFKALIQLVRKDRMTATEVLQVMEQNQRILSPFMGKLKSEDVGPTIERVFAIMLRSGAFLPMPARLKSRDIGIQYVSPQVKNQRIAQARGLAQFLEITSPLAGVDASVHDNLDVDAAYRDTADILGLPKTWLRKLTQVKDMRAARQQVQQEAAQRQAASENMQTIASAAGAARDAGLLPQGAGVQTRQTLNSPSEAFADAA